MYNKFWNKKGNSCLIKTSKKFLTRQLNTPFKVLFKFKNRDSLEWMYYAPNISFNSIDQVIAHVIDNLENTNMIFKISPAVEYITKQE